MTKLVTVFALATLAAIASILTVFADVQVVAHPAQKISFQVDMAYDGDVFDADYVGSPAVRTFYAYEDNTHATSTRWFQWTESSTPPNQNWTYCVGTETTNPVTGVTYYLHENLGTGTC